MSSTEKGDLSEISKLTLSIQNFDQSVQALNSEIKLLKGTIKKYSKASQSGQGQDNTPFPSDDILTHSDGYTKARTVYCQVNFVRIGEIDTIKENYEADIIVQARWLEPELVGKKLNKIKWSSYWKPTLKVENAIGELKEKEYACRVQKYSKREIFVVGRWSFKGKLHENMELEHFPFDNQDLSVLITGSSESEAVDLVEDEHYLSYTQAQSFIDKQEWELHEHVEITPNFVHEGGAPALKVTCQASRRPGFFLWNILLVAFIISALSLVTFAVPINLVQNRIQLSFILTLAMVTYKFVVANNLPKISYLTYLDYYVISCMILIFFSCVWHALGFTIRIKIDEESMVKEDLYVFIAIATLYVIWHVGIFLWIFIATGKKRKIVKNKKVQFLKKKLGFAKYFETSSSKHSAKNSSVLPHSQINPAAVFLPINS